MVGTKIVISYSLLQLPTACKYARMLAAVLFHYIYSALSCYKLHLYKQRETRDEGYMYSPVEHTTFYIDCYY